MKFLKDLSILMLIFIAWTFFLSIIVVVHDYYYPETVYVDQVCLSGPLSPVETCYDN